MELSEIKAMLDGSSAETLEEWDKINRETGVHTVALFAMKGAFPNETLDLAGTGTLIVIDESYYILTALHVWEDVLQRADRLGISIVENLDQNFPIDIEKLSPFAPMKPIKWNEWGPDIVLLRLPLAIVGSIKARRSFYYLPLQENNTRVNVLETQLLFGTPAELGTITKKYAQVQITGCIAGPVGGISREGYDYQDVEIDLPGISKSFGGMSGGGLWKVLIFSDPQTGKIASEAFLVGVAFWELSVENGHGIIRCHKVEKLREIVRNSQLGDSRTSVSCPQFKNIVR